MELVAALDDVNTNHGQLVTIGSYPFYDGSLVARTLLLLLLLLTTTIIDIIDCGQHVSGEDCGDVRGARQWGGGRRCCGSGGLPISRG